MVPKLILTGLLAATVGLLTPPANAQAPSATTAYRRPVQYAILYAQSINADHPAGDARLELQYSLVAGYTVDEKIRLRTEATKVTGFASVADALNYLSAHGWKYVDAQTDVTPHSYWQRYTLRWPLN
ncbi:hypothetical protein [Hymenobacter sp. PAMC 26628]|uniref:hypothetical protein n=1 Tax=Hymenobacter sp. PAMC 26628 TaxID=1484118 RepID=UPI000770065B|nr:hypothetical protein [Hymenobacter sp. PAMC 26628]AMJ67183.1 hypothetical protein AXW84_18430 [Hymenobacter sp. PAMC 26628]